MRIFRIILLSLFCVLLANGVLFASGQDEMGSEMAEEKEIILMHDKGGVPNFQPFYEATTMKTEAAIGVGFTATPFPSTDVFQQAVRSALPTQEPPDLFTWWSTYRAKQLYDQDLLADTTAIWDKYKDEYPPGIRDAFSFDGKVFGISTGLEYWPVYYNKDVFADLGLSIPETWDDFIEICDTLVANDIAPLMQSVQDRWPTFIMFEEMLIGEDPDIYVDLCEGKIKFSHPRVVNAFEVWRDMIEKGYFTEPSTNLFSDAPRLFNEGKIAMGVFGTWYYTSVLVANGVPEDKIGLFILPSHNDDAGKNIVLELSPLFVSANTQSMDRVMQIADWYMSAEGSSFWASQVTAYPANKNADTGYMPAIKGELLDTILDENYRVLNRYWEATPSEICEVAVDKFAEFVMNPDQLDKIIMDLDKVADAYWAKN
jgi:ABC-type glycerol-3-phosphate transport system substrate-binding protein